MNVPFVDLKKQYKSIKPEMDAAIEDILTNTAFIGGAAVSRFEEAFAEFIGTRHCVACANGTDSLEILLRAYGIGAGDEVIVPANSWISTSEVVSSAGARPVFVDVDPLHYTIDPQKAEEAITSYTRAIIPVHLYGLPAEMDAIMSLADRHNLIVIEDSAQAHGAEYKGRRIGTIGHAASFSFYPGKNLGAYGDAGGIVTNDGNIARTCRMIANHGQLTKHDHQIEGRNSRMDGLQAAVLNVKLKYLPQWTESRRNAAEMYDRMLESSGLQLPVTPENVKHVYHLYVVQVDNREAMRANLTENNIQSGIHYPTALPLLPAYSTLGHRPEDFPVASKAMNRILSLPMFAELSAEQIEHVCRTLCEQVAV